MIRLFANGACLAVALGAIGCGSVQLALRPEPRSFTARDYEDVYDDWTRDADTFDFGQFSDVLDVTATFQSWEQRWAYVVRYSEDYGLDTDARAEMLRATLEDAEQNHRFFVTFISTDWRSSDLTSERTSWRVLLVDEDGRETVPVEIEKIDRPDPATQAYFPSVSPLRYAFRIVFPAVTADGRRTIAPDARFVVLRFTGAEGQVDLRWEFTPSAGESGPEDGKGPAGGKNCEGGGSARPGGAEPRSHRPRSGR
jgi:hypothetical protein